VKTRSFVVSQGRRPGRLAGCRTFRARREERFDLSLDFVQLFDKACFAVGRIR